jgi:hypothetical protein
MSLPVKATIQAVVMLVIAGLLWKVWDHRVMPCIIVALAAVTLVGGLFIPPLFRAIERFGQWLGKTVGLVLTWGLLVPFYYLCFVPARIALKLRGVDPMHRECPTSMSTYWIRRPPVRSMDQYRKQH